MQRLEKFRSVALWEDPGSRKDEHLLDVVAERQLLNTIDYC